MGTTTQLADNFYQYKFFVTFENGTVRYVSDPCTKYGGSDDKENSAFVVGGPLIAGVQAIARLLPPRDLVLYEMISMTSRPNIAVSAPRLTPFGINSIICRTLGLTAWNSCRGLRGLAATSAGAITRSSSSRLHTDMFTIRMTQQNKLYHLKETH
jgi:hypothetical protein